MKRRWLLVLLVIVAKTGPVAAQEATPASMDSLLQHLVGSWRMAGMVRGRPAMYHLEATRVLQDRFVELHMEDVATPPQYEARVFIGVDSAAARYIVHWLDSFGAAYSIPHAVGRAAGDTIQFTFEYADGPFRDTFVLDPPHDSWHFRLESGDRPVPGGSSRTTTCSAAEGLTDRRRYDSHALRFHDSQTASNHAATDFQPPCPSASPWPWPSDSPRSPPLAQSIGAYNPPKTWPERPRRFDLVHQRIAIAVDWSHLAIAGQVQTTVVATTATDTVRLDADHLTIISATDAEGQEAQVHGRHHPRDRAAAEAAAVGDTVRCSPCNTRGARARALLRAAAPRDLDPGRGDRDPELGADLRLPERQDHLGVPGHGRLRHDGALQREPCRRDAGPGRPEPASGTGSRRSPRRPTSIRS